MVLCRPCYGHTVACPVFGLLCPLPREDRHYFEEKHLLLSPKPAWWTRGGLLMRLQPLQPFHPTGPQVLPPSASFHLWRHFNVFNLHSTFCVRSCCSELLINTTSHWVNLILIKGRKMTLLLVSWRNPLIPAVLVNFFMWCRPYSTIKCMFFYTTSHPHTP